MNHEGDDLDGLLASVDGPRALPEAFRERLRSELVEALDDRARAVLAEPVADKADDSSELVLVPGSATGTTGSGSGGRRSRRVRVGARVAGAVVAVVVGVHAMLILVPRGDDTTSVAGDPDASAPTPTPDVDTACSRFRANAFDGRSRATTVGDPVWVFEQGQDDVGVFAQGLRAALDTLVVDLLRIPDVPTEALRDLQAARGQADVAAARALNPNRSPYGALEAVDAPLVRADVALVSAGFARCID